MNTKRSLGWYIGRGVQNLARKKSRIGSAINKAAGLYVSAYEDRTDDARFNGEHQVLRISTKLKFVRYFDVGANVGEWTQSVLRFNANAEIHAFEINPSTVDHLKKRFSVDKRVTVNNFGLSNETSVVPFLEHLQDSKQCTLLLGKPVDDPRNTMIGLSRIVVGDNYCGQLGIEVIDMLKVDAEGSDHLVLRGFSRLLGRRAIRLVQFEYGYSATLTRFLLADFVDFFGQFGYRVARINSHGISSEEYNWTWNNFESGPNFIAYKNDDEALKNEFQTPSVDPRT